MNKAVIKLSDRPSYLTKYCRPTHSTLCNVEYTQHTKLMA